MQAHQLEPGDHFTHEGSLTLLERLDGPAEVVTGLLAIPFRRTDAHPDEPICHLPADVVVIVHRKPAPIQ
jgi:hypothetical protein